MLYFWRRGRLPHGPAAQPVFATASGPPGTGAAPVSARAPPRWQPCACKQLTRPKEPAAPAPSQGGGRPRGGEGVSRNRLISHAAPRRLHKATAHWASPSEREASRIPLKDGVAAAARRTPGGPHGDFWRGLDKSTSDKSTSGSDTTRNSCPLHAKATASVYLKRRPLQSQR